MSDKQVITIDDISAENAPVIYVAGGLKQFLDHARSKVTGEVPDLTTRKGRDRIASLAAEVGRSKVAVEKPGRDYLRRIKEIPKVVEAELREFVTSMDALRDATRQPLTDWEAADLARRDKHTDGIQRIKDLAVLTDQPDASHIAHVINDLELVTLDDSWEEFLTEAAQAKDRALISLRSQLVQRQVEEAQQAELARLRAEAEARAKADRESAIAREAVERAQREADERATAERAAAAKREQDLLDQAATQQRAAEQAARETEAVAELQRLQLQLQAEQAERQAAQAEANRIAAEQRAEQNRIDAEVRHAKAVEQARLDELARQQAAADEILRQEKLREADKTHKGKINRAALEAFMAGGMPEDCAKQAVKLIAQRKIPQVQISY